MKPKFNIRVGQGYDIHALTAERNCIIGGVKIDFERGLAGHSDADVLLHAIIDALLGAAALGDIGSWFPDTDTHYRDSNSAQLLKTIHAHISANGWYIGNIDCTIIAEKPKLQPYKSAIQKNIAKILTLHENQVNIKAKTNEGFGYLGRNEAIEAQAVCLLYRE